MTTKEKPIEDIVAENNFLSEENEKVLRRVAELETIVQHQRSLLTYHGATNNYAELFKKVDENKKYGLLLLDSDYKIAALSETAKKILGYKPEDKLEGVIGEQYTKLMISEDARSEFNTLAVRGKVTGEGFRQIIGIKKKEGLTYVKSRAISYLKTGKDELIGLLVRFHKN